MRRRLNFIVYKWNSFLLSLVTLWLASRYLQINAEFVGIVALLFAVIKLIGIFINNTLMRTIGIIGINILWALTTYYVVCYTGTAGAYPAFVLMIGFGISLQERFHE